MPPATATSDPAAAALSTTAPAPAAGTVVPQYNYSDNVSGDQALQDLTNFQTGQKAPVDIYNEAVAKLGIADVRTNVTNLRKNIADTNALLSALPDSVAGRTSGSLVTEAQKQRVLATERAPLDQANANYSNNYNMESANLNDLTNQANTQTGLITEGQKNIENALTTRLSSIQSREAEAQRRVEADRAFQATLDSIRVQQAQFAKTFAEQQRQFNVSTAQSAAKAAAPSVLQQAANDARNLLKGLLVRKAGYTESYIRPQIEAAYPELTAGQVQDIVYAQRHAMYGS